MTAHPVRMSLTILNLDMTLSVRCHTRARTAGCSPGAGADFPDEPKLLDARESQGLHADPQASKTVAQHEGPKFPQQGPELEARLDHDLPVGRDDDHDVPGTLLAVDSTCLPPRHVPPANAAGNIVVGPSRGRGSGEELSRRILAIDRYSRNDPALAQIQTSEDQRGAGRPVGDTETGGQPRIGQIQFRERAVNAAGLMLGGSSSRPNRGC